MRKVRNFVMNLCTKNRTNEKICVVAKNTKWKKDIEEIKSLLKKRGDKWRKRKNIRKS